MTVVDAVQGFLGLLYASLLLVLLVGFFKDVAE